MRELPGETKMKLTKKEKEICARYSARDPVTGRIRCNECPLRADTRYPVCKAVMTAEEWRREGRHEN